MAAEWVNIKDFDGEGDKVNCDLPFPMETLINIACALVGKSARRSPTRLRECIIQIEVTNHVVIHFNKIGKRRSVIVYGWKVEGEEMPYAAESEGGTFDDEVIVTIARLDILAEIYTEWHRQSELALQKFE